MVFEVTQSGCVAISTNLDPTLTSLSDTLSCGFHRVGRLLTLLSPSGLFRSLHNQASPFLAKNAPVIAPLSPSPVTFRLSRFLLERKIWPLFFEFPFCYLPLTGLSVLPAPPIPPFREEILLDCTQISAFLSSGILSS